MPGLVLEYSVVSKELSVFEHVEGYGEHFPGQCHACRLVSFAIEDAAIEGVEAWAEVRSFLSCFYHDPAQPGGALFGDGAVVGWVVAGVGAGDETWVATELFGTGEAVDVAYFGGDHEPGVGADAWDGFEEGDCGLLAGPSSDLPAEECDMMVEVVDEGEVMGEHGLVDGAEGRENLMEIDTVLFAEEVGEGRGEAIAGQDMVDAVLEGSTIVDQF